MTRSRRSQINQAMRLPINAVISWVMENVIFAAARTFGRASGFGSFAAMLDPKFGSKIRTTVTPKNADFTMEPKTRPNCR